MYGVLECKNKNCGVCIIIIEGKPYTFENTKTTFKVNKKSKLQRSLHNLVLQTWKSEST